MEITVTGSVTRHRHGFKGNPDIEGVHVQCQRALQIYLFLSRSLVILLFTKGADYIRTHSVNLFKETRPAQIFCIVQNWDVRAFCLRK